MYVRSHRSYRNANIQLSLFTVSILLSVGISQSYSQSSVAFGGVDTLVDKAIELVYHKKYVEAIKMCEEVIRQYPDNPMGYLGQAGVYHILMLNYRVTLFDSAFDSLTTLSIKTGEKAVAKNRDDAKAYFVLGAGYGFRGLNRIRKGQWFGAFRDGVRGVSNIMTAHQMDKTLYDTYYGLGLYYYWKSAKARVLTFLRLMKDERDKGIEYLKIAIDKGRFSAIEAMFALIEIYYYEDRYEDALNLALSLEQRFSADPTWNYLTAKIFDKLNRWQEARNYFISLLELLNESPFKSYNYLAECHYGIAKCSFEMGDYQMARDELNLAFQLCKLWDKEQEIQGPLLDFDKVLVRMETLDKELINLTANK